MHLLFQRLARRSVVPVALISIFFGLVTGVASAEGVVIGSGGRGGYYHAVARGLRVVLYSEFGVPTDVVASEGSMENLAALADKTSLVNVILAQADALQSYLAAHPEFADEYVQVSDAGKECAFLVTSTQSGLSDLSGLAGEGKRTIAVGESGSGATVTWANLTRLRPALAATKAKEQGVIEALLEMRASRSGTDPIAAMIVQRPMAVATPLEIVLQNRSDYALVPIVESDLQPPGRDTDTPVYSFEEVVVGFGRDYQMSVNTICTRALVLAAKHKLTTPELDAVGKAVLSSRRYIMPGSR